uniref:Uncharacterized protein n=1 Tax=Moniliophthora roreri TaxID=221103 RepID=A0A0W0GFH7_MONRR
MTREASSSTPAPFNALMPADKPAKQKHSSKGHFQGNELAFLEAHIPLYQAISRNKGEYWPKLLDNFYSKFPHYKAAEVTMEHGDLNPLLSIKNKCPVVSR